MQRLEGTCCSALQSPATDAPRHGPQHLVKLPPRPRLRSPPCFCLSPGLPPPRIPKAASGWCGLVGDCSWEFGGGGFQRTSSTWKGRREHCLDLQVWRLVQGARSGRWRKFYWRTETLGFFVVRDSLVSLLSCYGLPRPQNLTPTAPKVPSGLQTRTPGLAGRTASCPPCSRVTAAQRSAWSDAPSGRGGYTPPRTARGSHLPTPRGFPRTTVFAAATPSSGASPPVGASVPTSQALCEAFALPRLWGVPLGFLALATSLRAHRYSGAPKPGGGAGPGRGRSARKVSASGTSSSPRARESLRNFVFRASKSALLSARAHTHSHVYTITRLHTHTLPRSHLHRTSRRIENLCTLSVIS